MKKIFVKHFGAPESLKNSDINKEKNLWLKYFPFLVKKYLGIWIDNTKISPSIIWILHTQQMIPNKFGPIANSIDPEKCYYGLFLYKVLCLVCSRAQLTPNHCLKFN